MSPQLNPPELSAGAAELLRIARENDKHSAMMRNAALLNALSFTDQLLKACRSNDPTGVMGLLQSPVPPANFLIIVALTLRSIQHRLDDKFSASSSKASLPVMTDFNVHVLQAVAHALADFAWASRKANDFDGPALAVVMERLAAAELFSFWRSLVQHYVANILQDVFAAARIRETIRDLSPNTESLMRSEDAYNFATYVFDAYEFANPEGLMHALEEALRATVD
jgi:hypothetical protein